MERDSSGRFTPGTSGNPTGRPRGSLGKLTLLAKALTEPKAQQIIDRALVEATFLKDPRFVLFFMERIWPRSQSVDEGLLERLADLERRITTLEDGSGGAIGVEEGKI
jgi:hypothetical protein